MPRQRGSVDEPTPRIGRTFGAPISSRRLRGGKTAWLGSVVSGLCLCAGAAFAQPPPTEIAPPSAVPTAEAPPVLTPEQIEAERLKKELAELKKLEAALESPTADELRHEQNRSVIDAGSPLPPSDAKTSLFRHATRVFSRHKDFEDAHSAAAALDPAAFERAKSLIIIADAERMTGQAQQAWWSLHEAQQIGLTLNDQEQALTVFRQIGEVERNLVGPCSPTQLDPTSGELVHATIAQGLPNPGYEEVEILRQGGGPLREAQFIRHTYYYNGRRKFQGPMLRGGPTIVRVTHPHTNCPCDICVNLPRGAPLIEYSSSEIDYSYPDVEVHLHFYRSGKYSVGYSHFDATLHRWVRHLTPQKDESGFWFFGGETNLVKNSTALASGPVSNVASRFPLTAGLIRPEQKRIRNTLTPPTKLGSLELLKRNAVR